MGSLEDKTPSRRRLQAQGGSVWRPRLALGAKQLALLAVLLLAALLSAWHLLAPPRVDYILVIDAGSSGTRMFAYTWRAATSPGAPPLVAAIPPSAAAHAVPRRAMPAKRAYQRVETEPGLDRFVGDKRGLQEKAIGPLLRWAQAVVPRHQWPRTPVFMCATAGLRKLPEHQQEVLMDNVKRQLRRSPFRFEDPWARIITGVDEGVFGWIALNYLAGAFGSAQPSPAPSLPGLPWASAAGNSGQQAQQGGGGAGVAEALRPQTVPGSTIGVLDLGGSSFEVAFELDGDEGAGSSLEGLGPEDTVNVTVLGKEHRLYVHVHHHYGLNDAFDRSVSLLLSASSSEAAAAAEGGGAAASGGSAATPHLPPGGGTVPGSAGASGGASGAANGVPLSREDVVAAAVTASGGSSSGSGGEGESGRRLIEQAEGEQLGREGAAEAGWPAEQQGQAGWGAAPAGGLQAQALQGPGGLAPVQTPLQQQAQQQQAQQQQAQQQQVQQQQAQPGSSGGAGEGLSHPRRSLLQLVEAVRSRGLLPIGIPVAAAAAAFEERPGAEATVPCSPGAGVGGTAGCSTRSTAQRSMPQGSNAAAAAAAAAYQEISERLAEEEQAMLPLHSGSMFGEHAGGATTDSVASGGSRRGQLVLSGESLGGVASQTASAQPQQQEQQRRRLLGRAAEHLIDGHQQQAPSRGQRGKAGTGAGAGSAQPDGQRLEDGNSSSGGSSDRSSDSSSGGSSSGGIPAVPGASDAEGPLVEVHHPCLHAGYAKPYSRLLIQGARPDPPRVMLVGRPDPDACADLAASVVNASAPCGAASCVLGAPQPRTAGPFQALTGFYVVYHFFGLHAKEEMQQLEQVGREFCSKPWRQVEEERANEIHVDRYCFRAPFVLALLSQGLRVGSDRVRLGHPDIGWTLGAAIAEGSHLGLGGSSAGAPALSVSRQGLLPGLHAMGPWSWRLLAVGAGVLLLLLAVAALLVRRLGGGAALRAGAAAYASPASARGVSSGGGGPGSGSKAYANGPLGVLPLQVLEGGLGGLGVLPGVMPAGVPRPPAGYATGGDLGELAVDLEFPPGLSPPVSPVFQRFFGTPPKKRPDTPPGANFARGWGASQGERDMLRREVSATSLSRLVRSQAVSRRGISAEDIPS